MPWDGDRFLYTSKLLRAIAEGYDNIYQGIEINDRFMPGDRIDLMIMKSDFDYALNNIGRGKWSGKNNGNLKGCSKLQGLVIKNIQGNSRIEDNRLLGYSYYLMALFLNGEIPLELKT